VITIQLLFVSVDLLPSQNAQEERQEGALWMKGSRQNSKRTRCSHSAVWGALCAAHTLSSSLHLTENLANRRLHLSISIDHGFSNRTLSKADPI
jgi:hypothetical protein